MYELRPCITTLLIVYPSFLLAGAWFFCHVVKKHPHKDPVRNKLLTPLRFALFVVLIPIAAVLALAVLGWLDPLYFIVRQYGG